MDAYVFDDVAFFLVAMGIRIRSREENVKVAFISIPLIMRVLSTVLLCLTSVSAFQTPTQVRSRAFASPSALFAEDGDFDFDVAIIGCGVGGHGAALHSRGQKLKTAVFSGEDVGGTCVNRGCVPSKALLAASGRVREMRNDQHLKDLGIEVKGEVEFSREGIANHAKNLANRVKGNLEASLVGLGVDVIEGRGVLTGKPHEVKDEKTGKVYKAKVRWLLQWFLSSHFCNIISNSLLNTGYHFGTWEHSFRSSRYHCRRNDRLHFGRSPQSSLHPRMGCYYRKWLHWTRVFRCVHSAWCRGHVH